MFRNWLEKLIYGGGVLFDLTKWFVMGIVILTVATTFFLAFFVVDGESMEPNLHTGEMILWQKNAYSKKLPSRNDIVVVNFPGDPVHRKYVKRIVGLPNETIKISNGKVYINGVEDQEDYLSFDVLTAPDTELQLGSDQYFVMGDNRENSSDSRNFGPVEKRFVLGRSLAIIFPRFRLTKDI
ncbi:MAG: signal peptidase I [Candidatus Berkelbacteria bacterium]|nr:signal peptidase I [Candidatus Berkelbacteria bacterium]